MNYELFQEIIKNIAVLCVMAYLSVQLPPFRRAIHSSQYSLRDQGMLMLVFGLFSAMGNYLSIPIMGALAHTRMVGAAVGGLMGGPLVGIGAGIIGAIPRYFIGGYIAWPAILANIAAGWMGGWVCRRYGARRVDVRLAFWCSLASEVVLKGLVLTLSSDLEAAWELEKVIALPTTIANSLGIVLFVYIVRDVFREQEKLQARSAQQAMEVIQQASGLLREGLTGEAAQRVAEVVLRSTGADAVAVTGPDTILAFAGDGADHHRVGGPVLTALTRQAIADRKPVVVNDARLIGCPEPGCPLSAVVSAPLLVNDRYCGSLKLYKSRQGEILPHEEKLVQGIAEFLSLQLLQAELDRQTILLAQAEYNSLKSQIHPHFLYNVLGTIRAVIRTEPAQARDLVADLSEFLRRHATHGREFVSLAGEMECVRSYLRLEMARFEERIRVEEALAPDTLEQTLPVFALQVLVENAVKHGLAPRRQGGKVVILSERAGDFLRVAVEDNGMGMSPERLDTVRRGNVPAGGSGMGLGLHNVRSRLASIYGAEFGLDMESREGGGTTVSFRIPWREKREGEKAQ